MLKLGDQAQDPISGMIGVVICIAEWLHGCRRITLQPEGCQESGKPKESWTFDEPQLVLVESRTVQRETRTGGPVPEPQSKQEPSR